MYVGKWRTGSPYLRQGNHQLMVCRKLYNLRERDCDHILAKMVCRLRRSMVIIFACTGARQRGVFSFGKFYRFWMLSCRVFIGEALQELLSAISSKGEGNCCDG